MKPINLMEQKKKWYHPVNILWGVAVVILSSFIVRNVFNMAAYPSQIKEAEAQTSSLAAELLETQSQISSREKELNRLTLQISNCQEEIEALPTPTPVPTPSPTPAPTMNPEEYDATVTYEQLFRNPQDYAGEKLCFFGEVGYVGSDAFEGDYFSLSINGMSGTSIEVFYDGSSGRVLRGDIVKVYGKVVNAHTNSPGLRAERIYYPDQEEIIDAFVDGVYGDNPNSDQLREGLKSWSQGIEDLQIQLAGG